jgi:hypothetical protein
VPPSRAVTELCNKGRMRASLNHVPFTEVNGTADRMQEPAGRKARGARPSWRVPTSFAGAPQKLGKEGGKKTKEAKAECR